LTTRRPYDKARASAAFARGLIGALAELDRSNDYVVWSGGRGAAESPWPTN
jgi:hypothetical protein